MIASKSDINHPSYYGGESSPHEVIKIIEHYNLGFHLGSLLKYVLRAGKKSKDTEIEDFEKAAWYLNRHIENLKQQQASTTDFNGCPESMKPIFNNLINNNCNPNK